jgi:hypothetical protein
VACWRFRSCSRAHLAVYTGISLSLSLSIELSCGCSECTGKPGNALLFPLFSKTSPEHEKLISEAQQLVQVVGYRLAFW